MTDELPFANGRLRKTDQSIRKRVDWWSMKERRTQYAESWQRLRPASTGDGAIIFALTVNLAFSGEAFAVSRALFAIERADLDFLVNFVALFLVMFVGGPQHTRIQVVHVHEAEAEGSSAGRDRAIGSEAA